MDMPDVERLAAAYTAAWNSGSSAAVAGFYAEGAEGIIINREALRAGRAGAEEMAAGFFAEVRDLALTCDGVRIAGGHVLYLWTFTGHHSGSGRKLRVAGWEEWEMDGAMKITSLRGWHDAADYARQVAGG